MQSKLSPQPSFVETLYHRSDEYFKTQSYGPHATVFGLTKSILLVLLYASAYYYFLFGHHSFSSLLGTSFLLGLFHVLLPVNIGHDAIHQTVSAKKWVNQLALFSLELTGANSFMYSKKHLEAHRNKELGNQSSPIETQRLLLQKNAKNSTVNLPYFFYFFYAVYMIFIRDFQLFRKDKDIPAKEWRTLVITKLVYAIGFLALPFFWIQLPAWQIACALLLMYLVVTILLVIILLMPTEKMKNSKLSEQEQINDQWVLEILAENVDFSPSSRVLNLLVGGANLNVVHYLFPRAHHVHYNRLAALLKQTALEYGVQYRKQAIKDVVGIHFTYIRNIEKHSGNVPTEKEIVSPSTGQLGASNYSY